MKSTRTKMPTDHDDIKSPDAIAGLLLARGYALQLDTPDPRVRVTIKLRVGTNEGGHIYVRRSGEIRYGSTLARSKPIAPDERRLMLAEDHEDGRLKRFLAGSSAP